MLQKRLLKLLCGALKVIEALADPCDVYTHLRSAWFAACDKRAWLQFEIKARLPEGVANLSETDSEPSVATDEVRTNT